MPAAFDAYFESMDEQLLSLMGEECSYIPKEGELRTVTAIADETRELRESPRGAYIHTVVSVLVSADTDTGIPDPQFGDAICRERDHLADGGPNPLKLLSFSGVVQEKAPEGHAVLRFERSDPYEIGGHRR